MSESDPTGQGAQEDGLGPETGNPGQDRDYLQQQPPAQVDDEAVEDATAAAEAGDDDAHTDEPAAR